MAFPSDMTQTNANLHAVTSNLLTSTRHLAPAIRWSDMSQLDHFVQFYELDELLIDSVSDFIGSGLGSGAACLTIITPAHLDGLDQRLRANGLDPLEAQRQGKYFVLDAAETLAQILHGESLDAQRLMQIVGRVIEQANKGEKHIRIFGEMVALLWQQGNPSAALHLESLWNELRSVTHPFSLLCAYPTSLFTEPEHEQLFAQTCELHSHVIPHFGSSQLANSDRRLHSISLLQQLHLASIVSSSDDAILSKDLDGIITSWNAAAERMYGYRAQEVIGRSVLLLFPEEDAGEFVQIMERIRHGGRIEHYETTRVRKDGSRLSVSITISPLKQSDGTIIGASTIARDISERKALEQQREAFVGLVTHELKNPLTALQGNVQLAQRRLTRLLGQAGPMSLEQQQTIEDVLTMLIRSQQQLRVEQRLINDLLDVSHIQQDKLELRLATFDLVDLVYGVVLDYQAAHSTHHITLNLPQQESIFVYADRDRITQVLSNYLTNALKFAPASKPIQVGIDLEETTIRVWVRDCGPGLSPEQQVHVWERFHQGSHTPVQNGWKTGLGLGLYICEQLIHRQDGQVGVQSSPGKGATFWFTLPIHFD